jgi:hypothetical protein
MRKTFIPAWNKSLSSQLLTLEPARSTANWQYTSDVHTIMANALPLKKSNAQSGYMYHNITSYWHASDSFTVQKGLSGLKFTLLWTHTISNLQLTYSNCSKNEVTNIIGYFIITTKKSGVYGEIKTLMSLLPIPTLYDFHDFTHILYDPNLMSIRAMLNYKMIHFPKCSEYQNSHFIFFVQMIKKNPLLCYVLPLHF